MKKLSICIPTYNRKEFLNELLINIQTELESGGLANDVEVNVLDNLSTDKTLDLKKEFPNVNIQQRTDHVEANQNFIDVCEMATGEYIHLIGDDDFYCPGAVAKLVEILNSNSNQSGLFLLNFKQVKKNIGEDNVDILSDGVILEEKSQIKNFKHINDLTGMIGNFEVLGFISANCMKRDSVNKINYKNFMGMFDQIYWILKSQIGKPVTLVTETIVCQRQANQREDQDYDHFRTRAFSFLSFIEMFNQLIDENVVSLDFVSSLSSKIKLKTPMNEKNFQNTIRWYFRCFVVNDLIRQKDLFYLRYICSKLIDETVCKYQISQLNEILSFLHIFSKHIERNIENKISAKQINEFVASLSR
ncbi:glycosyltransferase family 2 protein [Betaproteobacteria bacterium]|nr:glycosyltransferase family 2 protein [Betaproteobacteria bacterium]